MPPIISVVHQWLSQPHDRVRRDPQLHFVEQVALAPPEVVIDLQQQQQYEEELNKASAIPLPDADDEDIAE